MFPKRGNSPLLEKSMDFATQIVLSYEEFSKSKKDTTFAKQLLLPSTPQRRTTMKKIDEIDENFKVETSLDKDDIKFYSVLEKPFEVNGVTYENGKFRRMPEGVAKSVSEWVGYLHTNTSGGRVRFKTDSSYIAISAKMCNIGKMDHFAITEIGRASCRERVCLSV